MYSPQRRLHSAFANNTPPLTPNTVSPSSPIAPFAGGPTKSGRAAPTLPRSISPTSSAGQRPYSLISSAQSTFTSDFPSEFGSIRIRKETLNRGETPPPLPVNSMSIPRKAPPLVIDTSSPSNAPKESAVTRSETAKLSEVTGKVASRPPRQPEVLTTVNVHPSSDQRSVFSENSSEHDIPSQRLSEPNSSRLLAPSSPVVRAPIAPPRLSLSAGPNEDGEWSSTLLSSFDREFGLSEFSSFLSSPIGPTPSTSERESDPTPDSPVLKTPLAVGLPALSSKGVPSILTPQSAASSTSGLLDVDRDDSRRDTLRPESLLTPTPANALKYFSASSLLPTRSNSIRSIISASSRDANSSRGSLDDVENASIANPHLVRKVSLSGKAHAIAVRAKRRSATMKQSANGALPTLVPATPPQPSAAANRLTLNGAMLSAAGPLAAVTAGTTNAKRRPPPIRETNVSPSPSADEPPTPGLTNNSRKSTEHTDASSSIRSPMASPMVPGFSKGSSNSLPAREIYEDDEDDNAIMDDITSAYASDTFVDDGRSTRRSTQVRRESDVAYLRNVPPGTSLHAVHSSTPPHSAANGSFHLSIPSPVSPSPASPSSFSTTYAMYTGAGSVSDEPGRKRPPSLLGTQSLPRSPASAAPNSPMSVSALTPRASSSPQGAAAQGRFSPNAGIGAASAGLQTPVTPHPRRQVSPLDKELPPPPPIEDDASVVSLSKTNTTQQQRGPTLDSMDMMKSRQLFAPLNPYLSATDPLVRFSDLTQVAEGQWGPVYAARAREADTSVSGKSSSSGSSTGSRFGTLVAVKTIKVEEEGSPKVATLASELAVMANVRHEHVLFATGLFVSEDTLWVEMELMERSLADMLPLVEEGLVVSEPEVARFTSDVSSSHVSSPASLILVWYRYSPASHIWKLFTLRIATYALTICFSRGLVFSSLVRFIS
jgi:hypothetical protein